jgi:thiol-disulfide isomerase/thioredoxin
MLVFVLTGGIFATMGIRSLSTSGNSDTSNLPDLGLAPELTNNVWINSDHPLRLAELRGKVVLLEFWTFNCYNCQNTFPFMRTAYEKYKTNPDVVMIGVHYPETLYERDVANVQQAVKDDQLRYPVAIDNDGVTWDAYEMHAWPAFIIVDKFGRMRYRQIGEGGYTAMNQVIDTLLTVPGPVMEF